jgi:hypothetical protein
MSDEYDDDTTGAIDEARAKADIARGAKALRDIQSTAGKHWMDYWSPAVRGWRGLRDLAFKRSGVRDLKAQAYRSAMGRLLTTTDGVVYNSIQKETRSAMTQLIDHIDEIDIWYAGLEWHQRDRWSNPQTLVKHAPKHLLGGHGRNRPQRRSPGKKKGNPEAEALRAILIRVVTKYVMPIDAEEAKTLLNGLYRSDPDDNLDDLALDDEEAEGED